MEEDCEVSRPRLQRVYALKGAALSVNLTERERKRKRGGSITLSVKRLIPQQVFNGNEIKMNNSNSDKRDYLSLFSHLKVH